jgi:two-component system cell cycle sensor histidine kinase PleC
VESAVELVRCEFDAKQQTLDVRVDRALGEVVMDHRRVRQILVNLLSNASKFTGANGRVLLMARPAADGGAAIAIADTGIGMTHEEIMLAVKPFAQVDARRARAQEGTGLGLPLAMGLARLHGGSLHIESQPGGGTTVMLTLPGRSADHSSISATAQGRAA